MDNGEELSLIQKAQAGDARAFGALYDTYIEQIYRFVYYKTMHKETAEDIVSDVFVRAYEHINSYEQTAGGSFSAWLYTIARNKVIDFYRGKKQTVNIEDVFDISVDSELFENTDAKELLSKIRGYVQTLNPKQREIVMLRVWEDLSYKEIATIVGGTEESARMSFSRAVRTIRDTFGPIAAIVMFLLSQRYS